MSDLPVLRRRAFFGNCGNLLAFGAAFIVTCSSVGHFLPFPDVPVVRAKLEQFAAHRNDYDTLFLGSSHFYFQIIPSIFDSATAASGRPTRSFNAGIAGLRPPEDGYLLDQFLALSPANLRHVFIELAILRTRLDNAESRRAAYWHDWPRMGIVWRAAMGELRKKNVADGVAPMRATLIDLLGHISLFLRRETNVGRGELLARAFNPLRGSDAAADLGETLDGWIPANLPQLMPGEMRSRYEKALADRREEPPRKHFGDRVSQSALHRMVDAVERVGAVPILVVPPTTDKKNFRPVAPESRFIVLDFCDPAGYPDLFDPRNRLDLSHLNTAGSQIFTGLLAKRFLEETARRR